MRIALIGYGKMGKIIGEIAENRGHEIVLVIRKENQDDFTEENLRQADVAIEFTGPHSALDNVRKCLEWKVPVVCGSTGWKDTDEMRSLASTNNTGFIHSSNFSVGVNIFFAINERLAELMKSHSDYGVSVTEIHHTAKKDAPSGTAITIADAIIQRLPGKHSWINQAGSDPGELSIISKREDPAPGTHTVEYSSPVDTITITHTAHNRSGFATGAVLAAEFLLGKKGSFTMKDVLKFQE